MSEKPIIFTSESVRAILAGRKTQTRRVIKPQPIINKHDRVIYWNEETRKVMNETLGEPIGEWRSIAKLFGKYKVGDLLWVRETWWDLGFWRNDKWYGRIPSHTIGPKYVADGKPEGPMVENKRPSFLCKWRKRSSIHMPKWVARIWLEITNIRVERVQDISEEDALKEGMLPEGTDLANGKCADNPYEQFAQLWDSLNAKRGYGWDKNPWVWCIEFKRIERK